MECIITNRLHATWDCNACYWITSIERINSNGRYTLGNYQIGNQLISIIQVGTFKSGNALTPQFVNWITSENVFFTKKIGLDREVFPCFSRRLFSIFTQKKSSHPDMLVPVDYGYVFRADFICVLELRFFGTLHVIVRRRTRRTKS